MTGLVAHLLGPGLFGAELRDGGQDVSLRAEEVALVAGAADKRRREFALGRACAHEALAGMGVAAGPILRAADGAPLWPPGVVGSITHTQGYACAIVGASRAFVAIGVDAERIGGVGDELLPRLFDGREYARLMAMTPGNRQVAATLGFSAKEACFKAWGARFRDVHLEWGDGVFRTGRGDGRFTVQGDLVLTAIAI